MSFFDISRPSTWSIKNRVRPSISQAEVLDVGDTLNRASQTYHYVATMRTEISVKTVEVIEEISKLRRIKDDLPYSFTRVEDLAIPHMYGMTMDDVMDKIADFYTLRYNLCSSAKILESPPALYEETPLKSGFFIQASESQSSRKESGRVLVQLVNELNITSECINEVQYWIKEQTIKDPMTRAQSFRHMYIYIWRCLSLLVVLAQCLQIVTAYFIHSYCECPGAANEKYISISSTPQAPDESVALLRVSSLSPNIL